MSPQEFANKVSESTEHERLQVFLLQRISGYLHVIEWAIVFCAICLLMLVVK